MLDVSRSPESEKSFLEHAGLSVHPSVLDILSSSANCEALDENVFVKLDRALTKQNSQLPSYSCQRWKHKKRARSAR